jgi:CRP-like cAMP-binding protein
MPPTPAPDELLKRVPLFSALTDEDRGVLARRLQRRAFRAGVAIFHKEQTGDALYVVETGRVRLYVPTEGGEEFTVDLAGPGDVFGEMALLDGLPRSASAETLEKTTMLVLSRDDFLRQMESTPSLAVAIVAMVSRRLRNTLEYAESLAFHDLHARVARALFGLAQRYGAKVTKGVEIELELTQSDLARMVAATRERVNRTLASFRDQGLLEVRGRKIVLLNPEKLRERIY